MAQFLRQFSSAREMEIVINGGIIGGKDLRRQSNFFVHGLTLVFTGAFAGTVTFAATPAGVQSPLTFREIRNQIDTQTSSGIVTGLLPSGVIYFIDAGVPAAAVNITGASTALAELGLDAAGQTGTFYATSGGVAPRLLNVFTAPDNAGRYIALTEET